MKSILIGLLLLASYSQATTTIRKQIIESGYLANETGLAYSANFDLETQSMNSSRISAVVKVATHTFSNITGLDASSYTLNEMLFAKTAHGLSKGLPVLFRVVSGTAPSPLITETTYYAVPSGANKFGLMDTSTGAIAGGMLVLSSSSTGTQAYSVLPIALVGTSSFAWQVSNDYSIWGTYASSGTTSVGTSYASTTTPIDFGLFPWKFLRAAFTGPTTGGIDFIISIQTKRQ